jgi:hypothetical protein
MICSNFKKLTGRFTKERNIKIYPASLQTMFLLHLEDQKTKERLYVQMDKQEAINLLNGIHYQLFGTILNATGSDTGE